MVLLRSNKQTMKPLTIGRTHRPAGRPPGRRGPNKGQQVHQSKSDVGADKWTIQRRGQVVIGHDGDHTHATALQAYLLQEISKFSKVFNTNIKQYRIDAYLGFDIRTSRRIRQQKLVSQEVFEGVRDRDPRADNGRKLGPKEAEILYIYTDENSFEGVNVDWEGLAAAAGIKITVHETTIRKAAHTVGIINMLAVVKPLLDAENALSRRAHASFWDRYPEWHVIWLQIRVSDESHDGVPGFERGQLKLPRGMRERPQNVQRKPPRSKGGRVKKGKDDETEKAVNGPRNGDEGLRDTFEPEMVHYWAAVGYQFKSRLVFYNTGVGNGGNIDAETYERDILRGEVASWPRGDPGTPDDWILMEDLAPGHGKHFQKGCNEFIGIQDGTQFEGKPQYKHLDKVKKELGIRFAFFPTGGCDLNIAENMWLILEKKAPDHHHWPAWRKRDLLNYIWENEVPQRWIDEYFIGGNPKKKTLFERWYEVQDVGGQRIAA